MHYAADNGTANTYQVSLSPAPAAYTAGLIISFKAKNANTGAATLNLNSLGTAPAITKQGAKNLSSGDIKAGKIITVIYDGTNFQIISSASSKGKFDPTFIYIDHRF